jgi:6-phosphogluconolactonase
MQQHLVEDVPTAFADFVVSRMPRSLALSGGGTARAGYAELATRSADWSGTTFWFGDERWVPVADPDSNEGMCREVWLDGCRVAGIESLVGAGPDPEAAAEAYEAALRAAPPLDIVHLGLGPDGHTASIFPGSSTGGITDRWVVVAGDDAHPHPRLTFTFPALARAAMIVVTVAGTEKREAYAGVRQGESRFPASRLVVDEDLAARTTWLVDHAAADG